MKRTHVTLPYAVALGLLLVAALWWNAAPVSAGPELQVTYTPRPQLTATPQPTSTPKPSIPEAASSGHAPRLRGSVLDWGKGNMPAGVSVVLEGDGWQIPVETDESGEYRFQDIGNEVGFLKAIAPAGREDLLPLANELPVRIEVDKQLVVNMAFHSADVTPEPLVSVDVVVSTSQAEPNANVTYEIQVTNRWEQGINQTIVADYLPQGLEYVTAAASQGEVVYDRGLVWASLGTLPAGGSATVSVVAKVRSDVEAGSTIVNQASVYHSENVAVQADASIEVTGDTNHRLPETGLSAMIPVAGALLLIALLGARKLRGASR